MEKIKSISNCAYIYIYILGKIREVSLSGHDLLGWAILTQRNQYSPIFVTGELATGSGNESVIIHFLHTGIIPFDNCSSMMQVFDDINDRERGVVWEEVTIFYNILFISVILAQYLYLKDYV